MDATKFKSPVQPPRKAYNWKLILQNVIDTLLLLRRLSRSHASIDSFNNVKLGQDDSRENLNGVFIPLFVFTIHTWRDKSTRLIHVFWRDFAKDCLIDCLGVVVVYTKLQIKSKDGGYDINSLICTKRWTLSWMYQVFLHSPHMVNVSFMTSARPLRIYTGMIWKRYKDKRYGF